MTANIYVEAVQLCIYEQDGVDQGRPGFYAVFIPILCALQLSQKSTTLLSETVKFSDQ